MRLAMEGSLDEMEHLRRLALTDGDRDVILDSVIYVAGRDSGDGPAMSSIREYAVQYSSTTIGYDLAFTSRETLGITVHPDLTVGVRAPARRTFGGDRGCRQETGHVWILKQQRELVRYLPHLPHGSTSAAEATVTWGSSTG